MQDQVDFPRICELPGMDHDYVRQISFLALLLRPKRKRSFPSPMPRAILYSLAGALLTVAALSMPVLSVNWVQKQHTSANTEKRNLQCFLLVVGRPCPACSAELP